MATAFQPGAFQFNAFQITEEGENHTYFASFGGDKPQGFFRGNNPAASFAVKKPEAAFEKDD